MGAVAYDYIEAEAESKLTERYQTTVPEPVRKALGLGKHDRLVYKIKGGTVQLRRADDGDDAHDPALAPFLQLLARDFEKNPAHLHAIDPALVQRARDLVAGVELDLDAPLSAEDE
jgi:antitoxin PrlF